MGGALSRSSPPAVKNADSKLRAALKAYVNTYNKVETANRNINKNNTANFRAMNNVNKPLVRALRVYINALRPFVVEGTTTEQAQTPPPVSKQNIAIKAATAAANAANIASANLQNVNKLQEQQLAALNLAKAAYAARNKLMPGSRYLNPVNKPFTIMSTRLKALNRAVKAAQAAAKTGAAQPPGAGGAGPAAISATLQALRAVLDEFNNGTAVTTAAIPANNANKQAALARINSALANSTTAGNVLNTANTNRINRIKMALAVAAAPPPQNLGNTLGKIVQTAGIAHRQATNNATKLNIRNKAKANIRKAAVNSGIDAANVNTNLTVKAFLNDINRLNAGAAP